MGFENVLYEINDGILYLTLNRPEARNALTPGMWKDIQAAVEMARFDDNIKVVIVSGSGDKALASGADIQEIHDRETLKMLEGISTIALKQLEDLYKPVICAINGYALGGGCELAMACDIRIATSRSKFGQPETNLSIIPGAGGTQRLARLIGLGRAQDVILLGRKIGGPEAVQIGLATKCVPKADLMAEAKKMAGKLIAKGPVAIRIAKRVVQASMSSSQEVGELLEMLALSTLCSTEDKLEGVSSFLEKRTPEYKGK